MENQGPNINRAPDAGNRFDQDGYPYHVGKRRNGQISHFICSKHREHLCMATGKILPNGVIRRNRIEHCHEADPLDREKSIFLSRLFQKRTHSFGPSFSIYNELIEDNPNMLQAIPFADVQARMRRWKKNITPPVVRQYEGLPNIVQSPEWNELLHHERGVIYLSTITAANGQTAVIYGDTQFANRIDTLDNLDLSLSTHVLPDLDGTQMILYITAQYKKFALTFGYALIKESSLEIYQEIMQFIRREFLPNIIPASITTSYEYRLKAAITEVWPNIQVQSTFVSFCMVVLHEANADPNIDLTSDNHKKIIKKILLLSMEPEEKILETFNKLNQSIAASQFRDNFHNFLNFFRNVFIVQLTPAAFCFYQKDHLLTNMPTVTARKLTNLFSSEDKTFWKFYPCTLQVIVSSNKDLDKLLINEDAEHVNVTMSPRVNLIFKNKMQNLHNIQTMLQNGVITDTRFLEAACLIFSAVFDTIIFQKEFVHHSMIPSDPREPLQDVEPVIINEPMNEAELLLENHILPVRRLNNRAQPDAPVHAEPEPILAEQLVENNNIVEVVNNDEENLRNPYDFKCMVCRVRKVRMITRPCNCVCICEDCCAAMRIRVRNLQQRYLDCPLCNNRALTFETVFLPTSENEEEDYDYRCQICLENPVTHISQYCNQLQICHICVEREREQREDPNRQSRCPFCNIAGAMMQARFVPINNQPPVPNNNQVVVQ